MNDLWLAPATVAVGMYLLHSEVDWATFVGVGVMVLTGPVNGYLFARVCTPIATWHGVPTPNSCLCHRSTRCTAARCSLRTCE